MVAEVVGVVGDKIIEENIILAKKNSWALYVFYLSLSSSSWSSFLKSYSCTQIRAPWSWLLFSSCEVLTLIAAAFSCLSSHHLFVRLYWLSMCMIYVIYMHYMNIYRLHVYDVYKNFTYKTRKQQEQIVSRYTYANQGVRVACHHIGIRRLVKDPQKKELAARSRGVVSRSPQEDSSVWHATAYNTFTTCLFYHLPCV